MPRSKRISSKNGPKGYLRPKREVVVDTHVLKAAIQARVPGAVLSAAQNEAAALFDRILEVCPRIVFPEWQQKQLAALVADSLRTSGRRLRFDEIQPFLDLGNHPDRKVRTIKASSVERLTESQRKLFRGRNHKNNLRDDELLFETAKACGGLVITEDEFLLRKHRLWDSQLQVETVSVVDALTDGSAK